MPEVIIADSLTLAIVDDSEESVIAVVQDNAGIIVAYTGMENASASGGNMISKITGEAIGGHRAVIVSNDLLYYADKDTFSQRDSVLGITTGAAASGDIGTVQTYGELQEPSWNWTDGAIYLGNNGLLTQTAPVSGFLLQIGFAITATKIFINVKEPISLN